MSFDDLASDAVVQTTVGNLVKHSYTVYLADTGVQALEKVKELIPAGSSVMNGSSTTLTQIGFTDYLKSGTHPWNNLHAAIVAEKDEKKQRQLRRQAVLSEYYLGSVHALVENGEFLIASNTGSQLPHVVHTSPNLIFVVSTKKIVPTLADGLRRLEEHVVPLEDKRMNEAYGVGTHLNKIVIFKGENPMLGRKVTFILVKENLGF